MALVAVAAADSYKPSYITAHQHVPYYKFDWDVTAQGYGGYGKDGYSKDSYGEALAYHQTENREKDHTVSSWKTQLPGKAHINVDRDINAQAVQVVAVAPAYAAPAYKAPSYSPPSYKAPEYKETTYSAPAPAYKDDYKPAPAYKDDYKSAPVYKNDYKPAPVYKNDYKPAPVYKNDYKPAAPAYKAPEYKVYIILHNFDYKCIFYFNIILFLGPRPGLQSPRI